ncbi:hypothetical protein [Eubacterium sp. 1001713B170207_170306_E7]|uniref:hypothetical protein n=1 Tax=Eubacterium sp. 1001713B170207_170306_E7 TaxID=2787097 RepID=UPI00189B96B7|nr:hypothetical protein [Eubacterium sp. 1001713B170207_170306_E7]
MLTEEEIKSLEDRDAFEKLIMEKAYIGVRRINHHVVEEENCPENFAKIELSDYQKNPWKSGHWARLCQYENADDTNYIDIWIYTDTPIPPRLTEESGSGNGDSSNNGGQNSAENRPVGTLPDGITGGQQNLSQMLPAAVTSVISNLSDTTLTLQNDTENKPQIMQTAERTANKNAQLSAADKTAGRDLPLFEKAMYGMFGAVVLANLCLGLNLIKDFRILHWYKRKKKERLRKEIGADDNNNTYLFAGRYFKYWNHSETLYVKKVNRD